MFPLKIGKNERILSFFPTSLRFYSSSAILEPQIYVVVEQFGAESVSLLNRRLVKAIISFKLYTSYVKHVLLQKRRLPIVEVSK